MLDFPAPKLRAYPRETTIAEKFHAMVELGFENTRMKDFYDLWQMSQTFTFDGNRIAVAIYATFERRGHEMLSETPIAFTEEFISSVAKETQWKAFIRKNKLKDARSWSITVSAVHDWLAPIMSPSLARQPVNWTWQPGTGWH